MKFFRITNSGYKFDKRFFWAAEIIMILSLVWFASIYRFDFSYHPFFECKYSTCPNPMYQSIYAPPLINKISNAGKLAECNWCNIPILTRGTYGSPPPSKYLFFLIPLCVVALFAIAVLLNHLIHNRNKKFDLGLKEQYSWYNKLKFDEKE